MRAGGRPAWNPPMIAILISHRSSDNAEAQALKHWLGGPEPPLAPARVGERRTIRRRCRARPKRLAPGTSMPMVAPSDGDVPVPLIRKARETDVADILAMVGQLARHHGDEPRASLAGLERDLLGPVPWVTALVADGGTSLLGYAVLCRMYRARSGERGVDLHHLHVVERARSSGSADARSRRRSTRPGGGAAPSSPSAPVPGTSGRSASTRGSGSSAPPKGDPASGRRLRRGRRRSSQ